MFAVHDSVTCCTPAVAANPCGCAGGVVSGVETGAPATHVVLKAVPVMPFPEESATEMPEPSLSPQRPIRPLAEVISWLIAWSICASLRA